MKSSLPEYFKNDKPPTFDEEVIKSEELDAWLLGLKSNFNVHNYSMNMKARVAIYNLRGKFDIQWEDLKNVKGICENKLTWSKLIKYFKETCVFERYCDGKTKQFHEQMLGQLTMDAYANIFIDLLKLCLTSKMRK